MSYKLFTGKTLSVNDKEFMNATVWKDGKELMFCDIPRKQDNRLYTVRQLHNDGEEIIITKDHDWSGILKRFIKDCKVRIED